MTSEGVHRSPTRRGMRPAIDQPIRPSRCAATRFCAGIPARAATSKSCSSVSAVSAPAQRAVHAAVAQRHPRDGVFAPARIMPHDGTPDRLADFDRHARAAFHVDGLARDLERPHSGRRAIAILRPWGRALDDDEVAPVAVRVGEAPGDVPVAAGDQRRHARQASRR